MTLIAWISLVFIIGLPIGWLFSEFQTNRPLRIALGISAILSSFGVAVLVGKLSEFEYNVLYGQATEELLHAVISEVEEGQFDRVKDVLRALGNQYEPSYEQPPAKYLALVDEATQRMRGDVVVEKGSRWDVPEFGHWVWLGYWENESGFWLIIDNSASPYAVIRSGYPKETMEAVMVSDDFRTLTFAEHGKWRHTLTLSSKYEARHEWFDLEKNTVWREDRLFRAVRLSKHQIDAGKGTPD